MLEAFYLFPLCYAISKTFHIRKKGDKRMILCQILLLFFVEVLGFSRLLLRPDLDHQDYILSSLQYNPKKDMSRRNFVPRENVGTPGGY